MEVMDVVDVVITTAVVVVADLTPTVVVEILIKDETSMQSIVDRRNDLADMSQMTENFTAAPPSNAGQSFGRQPYNPSNSQSVNTVSNGSTVRPNDDNRYDRNG
jgi:hypothetical protein